MASMLLPLFDKSGCFVASAKVVRGGPGCARRASHDPAIAVFGYPRSSLGAEGVPSILPRSLEAAQVPCCKVFASAPASAADQPRPH